jgi:hypothetical protein
MPLSLRLGVGSLVSQTVLRRTMLQGRLALCVGFRVASLLVPIIVLLSGTANWLSMNEHGPALRARCVRDAERGGRLLS